VNELCGVREVSIGAVLPFLDSNLPSRGGTVIVVRVSYEFGFEEADEVRFRGGLGEGRRSSSGRAAGHEMRESGDRPSTTTTSREGML
jgi:hypothetical protein